MWQQEITDSIINLLRSCVTILILIHVRTKEVTSSPDEFTKSNVVVFIYNFVSRFTTYSLSTIIYAVLYWYKQ
jgi:hypothetical protein